MFDDAWSIFFVLTSFEVQQFLNLQIFTDDGFRFSFKYIHGSSVHLNKLNIWSKLKDVQSVPLVNMCKAHCAFGTLKNGNYSKIIMMYYLSSLIFSYFDKHWPFVPIIFMLCRYVTNQYQKVVLKTACLKYIAMMIVFRLPAALAFHDNVNYLLLSLLVKGQKWHFYEHLGAVIL